MDKLRQHPRSTHWAPDPIIILDPLNREIRVLPEYSWKVCDPPSQLGSRLHILNYMQVVEVIIKEQFAQGPGHTRVQNGEYELYYTNNSSLLVSETDWGHLGPSCRVTMGIIVQHDDAERCPNPKCCSRSFIKAKRGDNVWYVHTGISIIAAHCNTAQNATYISIKRAKSHNWEE